MAYGKCFLSGQYGIVERHHIFGGALRSKSERYGLVVELSPWMHREGPKAAHRSRETMMKLKAYGQKKIMVEYGWDLDTFIREFGMNYLSAAELDEDEISRLANEERERFPQIKAEKQEDSRELPTKPVKVQFTITAQVLPF